MVSIANILDGLSRSFFIFSYIGVPRPHQLRNEANINNFSDILIDLSDFLRSSANIFNRSKFNCVLIASCSPFCFLVGLGTCKSLFFFSRY